MKRKFTRFVLAALFISAASALGAVPDAPPIKYSLRADDPAPKAVPSLDGPATAKYLATVKLAGIGAGDVVFWDVEPSAGVEVIETDCNNSFTFAGPAGEYTVKARVAQGGKKLPALTHAVTLTGGPVPKPTPTPNPPGPGPLPPAPTPAERVAKFVVVEDTGAAGAWRGDVLGSPKVAAWYKASGMTHRLLDVNGDTTDPAAAYYVKAAAGKKLPWLFQLDAGTPPKLVGSMECPTDPDAFLARFAAAPSQDRTFGAILDDLKMKWGKADTFGENAQTPIFPRDQWKPVTLATFLPPVYDQDYRGQCVGSSTCTNLEGCRAQAGLPYQHLSAGDLYSQINGGRDNGATLEDSMNAILTSGVTTTANVPYVWNGKRAVSAAIAADRKNYRAVQVYLCKSFDAAASALQQGFFLEEALTWYGSYMKPGPDGWLPKPSGGVRGGHALAGFGLVKRGTEWGILTRNSWGKDWGNSADGTVGAGNCVISEANFDRISNGGFFAIRAVVQTPTAFPFPSSFLPRHEREYALAP